MTSPGTCQRRSRALRASESVGEDQKPPAAKNWQLTGIPFSSMRGAGGIADAVAVLRERGLADRLRDLGVGDAGDLPLREGSGERGSSGLLNERALTGLVGATSRRVSECHARGQSPLLVGGDCPVLLGPLDAIRKRGERPGLVMVDGHEDAWPPARSPTGEASDSEIAIALGLVAGLPEPLAELVPLIRPSALAYIGPRDAAELRADGVESMRGAVAFFASDRELDVGDRAMESATSSLDADGFWLHLDLDVLSTEDFPAADYPQPGGVSWEQLEELVTAAIADLRFQGMSVVIYNPELDRSREAADALIDFVTRVVAV